MSFPSRSRLIRSWVGIDEGQAASQGAQKALFCPQSMHMVAERCGARSDLVRRAPVQSLEFGDPAVVVRLVAVLDAGQLVVELHGQFARLAIAELHALVLVAEGADR